MSTATKRKADDAGLDVDYNSMKVAELKAECAQRALSQAGRKADLIARLQEADSAESSTNNTAVVAAVEPGDMAPIPNGSKPKGKAKEEKEVKEGWAALSMVKLKEECNTRGISASGKKPELIARLEDDDKDRAELADPNYKPRVDELARSTGEKRLYPFVARPDSSQRDRIRRAKTQPMFMMERKRGTDSEGVEKETFYIAGSGGNLYETTIGRTFKCDCIDFRMGNANQSCKHVAYCLVTILKAPEELVCQRALLSVELRAIFENAPVTQKLSFESSQTGKGVRKPTEGQDCPVCVMEFEEGEDIVYCKAACGQNIHKTCFEAWRESQMRSIGKVNCVYCRQPWLDDESGFANLKASAPRKGWHKNIANSDFYKNALQASQGSKD